MGKRLRRRAGTSLTISARFSDPAATLELVTSGGKVVATGSGGELQLTRAAAAGERWYYVRAVKDGKRIAYGSPVWVEIVRGATAEGTWLAGDLHVHSCFSHDAYCGPGDDNTGPEEFYTLGSNVTQRFLEASLRGLDYLAVTDHNDVRSSSDPGFGSAGVVGVPGYENSLNGHAQMIGARKLYDVGDKSAGAVNAAADALRADGGVFQLNHPHNGAPWDKSCDGPELDWRYGTEVVPDVVEVWNSADFQLRDSTGYWEKCWLDRGFRIGATGGSDTHWAWLSLIQGAGNPTTWVLSDRRTPRAIQRAIKRGRTTISRLSPATGGAPLLIEADSDGDGSYESTIGDRVRAGAKMRVRSGGGPLAGTVRVRANGETIVKDKPLTPGGSVAFRAPREAGWVRAELWAPGTVALPDGLCEGIDAEPRVCVNDFGIVGLTSPIYLK
jgi:predicted metal-dependent phosphoesterase TrpH